MWFKKVFVLILTCQSMPGRAASPSRTAVPRQSLTVSPPSFFFLNRVSTSLPELCMSDRQIGLFSLLFPKPFETRIVSPRWPRSYFPSCCFWHPFGPYWCKWALATHCVPAWTTHFGSQVTSQGTSAVLTALGQAMDLNPKMKSAQGCIYF